MGQTLLLNKDPQLCRIRIKDETKLLHKFRADWRVLIVSAEVTKDEVIWSEELSEGSRAHAVHGSRFQVDQHGPGDVFMRCTQRGVVTFVHQS